MFRKIVGSKIPPKHIVLYYHGVRQEQCDRFAQQLEEIIRLARPFSLGRKYPNINGLSHVAITFDDGFLSFFHNALPELIKRNIPFTVFVPTGYVGKFPGWIKTQSRQYELEKVMNEEQLIELKKLSIAQIGSHCISHRDLTTLTDDEARDEIVQSKSDLEKIMEQKITMLSFPHGRFNQAHVEYAIQAGYERVFSIVPKLAFATEYEYITGRITTDPDDWRLEFRLKVLGAYRWLPKAFFIKRQIKKICGLE
jgi:peptidoglycan/xylan/chitin deacetylase (PgdA/CDA1 family)